MYLWNTNTLHAARNKRIILNQKTGSNARVFALVMNNNAPEGMIKYKPLCDQGSR